LSPSLEWLRILQRPLASESQSPGAIVWHCLR